MKMGMIWVVVMLGICAVWTLAGDVPAEVETHTNQTEPIPHSNQDLVPQRIDNFADALIFLDETFDMIAFSFAGSLGGDCQKGAVKLCGKGQICCFCTCDNGGTQICAYSCRQEDGTCQPCPSCGCNSVFTR